VPSYVLQRELASQAAFRFSETFRRTHQERAQVGVYKICVGLDGRVSSVQIVRGVGGDEEVVEQIREGFRYKPQAWPLCGLAPVTIEIR
jgi:hypothetical protein